MEKELQLGPFLFLLCFRHHSMGTVLVPPHWAKVGNVGKRDKWATTVYFVRHICDLASICMCIMYTQR